ncbi:MAG: hypothetical protein QHC40_07880 [Sphingobium sp.]|nr:hypothetical protein [Sphingobium sp.]
MRVFLLAGMYGTLCACTPSKVEKSYADTLICFRAFTAASAVEAMTGSGGTSKDLSSEMVRRANYIGRLLGKSETEIKADLTEKLNISEIKGQPPEEVKKFTRDQLLIAARCVNDL